MMYIRGFVGLGLFITGILMLFSAVTKPYALFAVGFGFGMITSGFS